MTALLDIIMPIAILALFFWIARLARDLAVVTSKKSPDAGGELGKIRENIEQLLDVLEERSQATEGQLRRLIEEAKGAAEQIDEATASAVKMLERASAGAAMAQAQVQPPPAAVAPALKAQDPPADAVPAAKAPAPLSPAPVNESDLVSAIEPEPATSSTAESQLDAALAIAQGAPAADAVSFDRPVEHEQPAQASVTAEAHAMEEEIESAAEEPYVPAAPEYEIKAVAEEPVVEAEVAAPVVNGNFTPSGLNPVPTDAIFSRTARAKPATSDASAPVRRSEPVQGGSRTEPGAMRPVHEVFTPWPGDKTPPPSKRDLMTEAGPANDQVDGTLDAAGKQTEQPAYVANEAESDPVASMNGVVTELSAAPEPVAAPNPELEGSPAHLGSATPESKVSEAVQEAAEATGSGGFEAAHSEELPIQDSIELGANGNGHVNGLPEEEFRPFAIKAELMPQASSDSGEKPDAGGDDDLVFAAAASSQDLSAGAREDAANVAERAGDSPARDPYSAVYTLTERGITDVADIAKRTGLGQTEVEMVLDLWRRQ